MKRLAFHNFQFLSSKCIDEISNHLPYFQSQCLKPRTFLGYNSLLKRTLRKNVSRVVKLEEESSSNDLDSFEQFMTTAETKPSRKPPSAQLEATEQQLFTVSNVFNEENTEEANTESNPEKKAIDLALRMRDQKAKKKSPFHTITNDMDPAKKAIKALSPPNLERMTDEDLALLMRRNVIYADKNLIIFNKPYGLPMHDGDNTPRHIKSVLPMLSKMIYGINTNIPLTICNRLDKFTTGVCVTTTDDETTRKVQGLFREHKILKKYWALTIYAPDPASGLVDIPLDRSVISGDSTYARMVAKPDVRYDAMTNTHAKARSMGQVAVTHYTTLDHNTLSLVELQPMTTIKHQLRVHLADGLDCPILGDHKYSHYGRLAPQVLPPKILRRLGIPFSKSRRVPMHLHLQSMLIPGIFPNRNKPNLIIGAKLPHHMSRTMRLFGLKPGIPTKWKGMSNLSTAAKKTADPRDKESKLYIDPTAPKTQEDELSADNIDSKSMKVFRNNFVRVKYKYQ